LNESLNFEVGRRGIYFTSGPRSTTTIEFFEFATERRTTIFTLAKDCWYGLALSPDEQYLVFSAIDGRSMDLMLVENFY
jgi:hypothetical protein